MKWGCESACNMRSASPPFVNPCPELELLLVLLALSADALLLLLLRPCLMMPIAAWLILFIAILMLGRRRE